MTTVLGTPAWFTEQNREDETRRAAEQAQANEAAKVATIPQSAEQAAMSEAYELYKSRMADEAQKTEAQRRREALTTELETVTANLQAYFKQATHYEKTGELPAAQKRFDEIWAELDQLNPPQPNQVQTNTITFDNGSIY